jgi:hypothetical protein
VAIIGVKNFQIGAILTAADLNTYNRGVFVFADAAARTSAFSSAGITLTEGWFSYLTGTNSTEYYDGAAWVAVAAANVISTVASASSIAVTAPGTYLLTGTTTVATITGGTTGMTITVQASAQASGVPVVLTYGTGANAIKLAGGRSLGIYAQVPADTAAGAGESVTLRYDGTTWVEIARDLRTLLAYSTVVTNQTIVATTEAGATAIATLAAITFDGATPVNIDFFAPYTTHSTAAAISRTAIWDGATEVNKFTERDQTYTSNMGVVISFPITPTAASHTYAVKSWVTAGNVIYYAGAVSGGAGVFGPISMRISRAL